jgi:monoamine oxidase
VQQLSYNGRGVQARTGQGEYSGKYALVTLPLGVLQSGKVSFKPGLPAEKREAIQSLGMGVLNKLYLRFERPLWPEDLEWLEYIPAQKGRWAEWLNLHYYTGAPVLLGFNAASYGREVEKLSDKETVAGAMATLRTIFGKGLDEPQSWQITRWASDPFALGSYSFNAVGANRQERRALAAPLEGRLFFAGEASAEKYPATVHGAYLSGLREAERIIDLD